ncbi:hypothetical protein HPULCUR_002584 [Helicostylum pulchrum]|uniref:GPI inositol-deacylase n=1 Tax=Helicostylum pulchrum TaxID=562976 RepID=A0ABP9XR03_9FUNG
MTFSYPKYIEIDNVVSTFSLKYKLYIYRDGYRDSDTLYGTPALFIPGQAGSYGQIRSLASTTTQLYHQNPEQRKNIDFFTVDLNEELSALNGQNLIDQAVYLNAVIKRIQAMYPRPVPVMIIGHSMGGIVARAMFMQPNYTPYSIRTIVTIATPHLSAPLLLDTGIYRAYKDIKTYWKTHRRQLKDTVLISIAGGSLDNIIHSDGVVVDKVVPKTNGFTTYTTSIPGVWTGCDHMAILWCKQFIQVLSSTLLDVVNGDNTVEERMRVFEYHLLQGMRIGQQIQKVDVSKLVNRGVRPYIRLGFSSKQVSSSITLVAAAASEKLELTTNIQPQFDMRWSIVGCDGLERLECSYIKPKVTLVPSGTAENLVGSNPYRLLQVVNNGFKYIGVIDHGGEKILDGDNEVFLIGRSVSDKPVVHPYHVWVLIDIGYGGISIHIDKEHPVHSFPFIRNSLFAFDIKIDLINGTEKSLFKPMMQQSIGDSEVKYFRGLEIGVSDRITFHQELDRKGLQLRFFMDNEVLDISIKVDWYATLGRCVLRYGSIMVLFFWAISFVVLLSQLYTYTINGKREFIRFEIALSQCLKGPLLQLVGLLLIASGVQFYYPSESILFGSDDWMMTGLLLFTFSLSIGLTLIIWLAVSTIVTVLAIPLRLFPMQVRTQNASIKPMVVHMTLAIALIGFVPSSVIFSVYFIIWLFMTAVAHVAARSDLPKIRNMYYYRLSWLVFLTSLLPYYVPSVIVYVKDIMIGWTHHHVSPIVLMQDIPALFMIIYLVTLGKNPDRLELK